MVQNDLLFVHPLLGADDAWSGYLVEAAPGAEPGEALRNLQNHAELAEFDQRAPWFLPAAAGQEPWSVPAHPVYVFEPSAAPEQNALEAALRKQHLKLGLSITPNDPLPMPGQWDYLLLGSGHARTLPPYTLLGMSARSTVVAVGVPSHADYKWLRANACSLSTTEFLLTRNAHDQKADMTRVKLLELLALIAEDADTESIEAIFRQEPKLSYSLLRLVNSAAMAPRSPITSFSQAINLLGRRQLQRWLQLLIYADPNNGKHPNPVLQKAAARGRLFELAAASLPPLEGVSNPNDAAFMVGAFSLLDVLLNIPMQEILKQLPLAAPLQAVLGEHQGPLGKLLRAQEKAESRDFAGAMRHLAESGLSSTSYMDAQINALAWAAKIHGN